MALHCLISAMGIHSLYCTIAAFTSDIPMEYSKMFVTANSGWSIAYSEGLQVIISKLY